MSLTCGFEPISGYTTLRAQCLHLGTSDVLGTSRYLKHQKHQKRCFRWNLRFHTIPRNSITGGGNHRRQYGPHPRCRSQAVTGSMDWTQENLSLGWSTSSSPKNSRSFQCHLIVKSYLNCKYIFHQKITLTSLGHHYLPIPSLMKTWPSPTNQIQ